MLQIVQRIARKKIGKTILLTAGIAVLLIALISMLATRQTQRATSDGEDAPAVNVSAETDKREGVNLLLVGTDRTSGLADVLLLLRLESDGKSACALQIPRDTYASYTEASYRKLNGALAALDGMEGLCSFLSEALGIPVDRYVRMDLDVLVNTVDILGGIEIELPTALDYEDPEQGLSIHLPAGKQTLDGVAAEQFVRYRSGYLRGDLGRMDAQKLFLAALLQKLRSSLDPITLMRLSAAVLPALDTNVSVGDAMAWLSLLKRAELSDVCFLTLPGEDAVATQSGASYYVMSAKATEEVLVRYFGAEEGCLDPERLFRNGRYEKFCEIYDGYTPYRVYSASEIEQDGVEIEKTPS